MNVINYELLANYIFFQLYFQVLLILSTGPHNPSPPKVPLKYLSNQLSLTNNNFTTKLNFHKGILYKKEKEKEKQEGERGEVRR